MEPIPRPHVFGLLPFDYEERYGALIGEFPDAGVLTLPGGRVVGPHGWPLTAGGEGVAGATAHVAYPDHSWNRPPATPVHLTGTVLSLCSDWASGNFSHFLVDALPRLSLVERSPVPLDGIDHYLIPPFEGGEAWVDRLGIPRTRVVWLDPTKEILADTLVVTSYPRPGRACPAWAVEFLRARVSASRGPSREEPPAFLARNSSFRLLANADEIEAIARSKGCRVLVPDAHTDVRRDLATVRAIVGPHGSALTNMVFAPRGARILVLSPSDQPDPFFYAVAVGAGLEFACLVGRSVATRPKGSPGQSPFDFSIEASAFEAALDALLSSRPL